MSDYITIEREKRNSWISDITNWKFGHLTALRPTDQRKGGAVVWECKCDCEDENIVYRTTHELKNEKHYNHHCGCRYTETKKIEDGKIADITGQRFGYLEVLRPTRKRSGGSVIWECRCRCGKIAHRSVSSLKTNGGKQSCGCMWSEIAKENNKKAFHHIDGTRIESIRNQPMLQNNKSGIRGVHFDTHALKWRAVIYFKSRQIHLGLFEDIEDAAKARKTAEELYYMPVIEEFEALEA